MSFPTSSFLTGTAAATESTKQQQKVISGYVLQQKLGSGSFAVVYKGVRLPDYNASDADEDEDAVVAIKAITRSSEKLTQKVLQNLEIEISILRTYRHRNIVCLRSVQKTERHFYLFLEYCAGGDVQRLIQTRENRRLTEGLTRRLMRDLKAGLQFLWSQELIHRDIKPQNLLLTGPLPLDEVNDPAADAAMEQERQAADFPSDQFALKIADFGFARHLQTTSLAETLCGSPLYMAPEILQHHRYDAKADLWSVGTVLFEMISGKPPFTGDNHIHLLKNIQRKAVRLPPNVRVSQECVYLLRQLLNRNPLTRAGFDEFFAACDAFVALGCQGPAPPADTQASPRRHKMDLGTIPENAADSLVTVQTHAPLTQQQQQQQPGFIAPPLGPAPAPPRSLVPLPALTTMLPSSRTPSMPVPVQSARRGRTHMLRPLVPSPPPSSGIPMYSAAGLPEIPPINLSFRAAETPMIQPSLQEGRQQASSLHNSTDENSFVMVEPMPAVTTMTEAPTRRQPPRLEQSPPASPKNLVVRQVPPILTSRGDYLMVKQPKGMLSTSPGTGGALMGMLSGRARLTYDEEGGKKQTESQIKTAAKLLAAAEDVGRRAISVAHLGDNRAYLAMKLVMMQESSTSSVLSSTLMEGIEEEEEESGAVTDDSSVTEIVTPHRRRRSSSATDKSMPDVKDEDEAEEMPFAVHSESSLPLLSAGIPTRGSGSLNKGASIGGARPAIKPTPATIRSHFGEALSCYIKALKMLKGAVAAAERVDKELDVLVSQRLMTEQTNHVQQLKKRCSVTSEWLSGQFKGVLERADAANGEIGKLSSSQSMTETTQLKTAEELIYTHSLGLGREGAVKQLLGQYEQARSCYRSAGLLAETLLMESKIDGEDRKALESYVDGFAVQITELDRLMMQHSHQSRSASSSLAGSRRAPGVVGLVGRPFEIEPNNR